MRLLSSYLRPGPPRAFAVALAVSFALPACSSKDAAVIEPPPVAITPAKGATVVFDLATSLALVPGSSRTVSVVATPPGRYEVTFTLLGAALDASLDETMVLAGADGRASVVLHAPDQATTFQLRASIADGASAQADVAVSDRGFGTLRIRPTYAGKRPVTSWTASVVARATCADLAPMLPGDPAGALTGEAPAGQEVVIANAPVGPNLAVAVRAGHYISGCLDASNLVAGAMLEVPVPVVDLPMNLGATHLALQLQYAPEPTPYAKLLGDATGLLLDSFLPAGGEVGALLDAMSVAAPSPAAFAAQRAQQSWDAATGQHLSGLGSLRDDVSAWAAAGLALEPRTLIATLDAFGMPAPGKALLQVGQIGSVSGVDSGTPAAHLFSWTASPGDAVQLSGQIYWMPTRYVGAVALHGAQAQYPGSVDVPSALAAAADCAGLGAQLGSAGSCDSACLGDLCQAALGVLWEAGLDGSAQAGVVGGISVGASGSAKVDDVAAPTLVSGVWLGSVTDSTTAVPARGKLTGAKPGPATGP